MNEILPTPVILLLLRLDMGALAAAAKIGSLEHLTDLASYCEDAFIPVINLAYDLNYVNANRQEGHQVPGYDLIDVENKRFMQVTVENNNKKKRDNTYINIGKKYIDKGYRTSILFISTFGRLKNTDSEYGIELLTLLDLYEALDTKIHSNNSEVTKKFSEVEQNFSHSVFSYRSYCTDTYIKKEKPLALDEQSGLFSFIEKQNQERTGDDHIPEEDFPSYKDDLIKDLNQLQGYLWRKSQQTRTVYSALYAESSKDLRPTYVGQEPPCFDKEIVQKLSENPSLNLSINEIYQIITDSDLTSADQESLEEGDCCTFDVGCRTIGAEADPLDDLEWWFSQGAISDFLSTCDFNDLVKNQNYSTESDVC